MCNMDIKSSIFFHVYNLFIPGQRYECGVINNSNFNKNTNKK